MTDTPVLLDLVSGSEEVRQRFTVTGVVQGVGFRPFVHRIASELGLAGFVGNDSGAVFLEVQGPGARVAEFGRRVRNEAPPLALISSVSVTDLATDAACGRDFRIVASHTVGGVATPIPPDVAVCDQCVAELFDPHDRRYRHPFVTCTNCGPRFTIIRGLPYDRPGTTMAGFTMCEQCAAEYHDPADRRFHAQPIACSDCGPSLWFSVRSRQVTGSDAALAATQRALAAGAVVAVKGIGGYHLACVGRRRSGGRAHCEHGKPGAPSLSLCWSATSARARRLCIHRRQRGRGAVESGPADPVAARGAAVRRSPTPSRPAARCWG